MQNVDGATGAHLRPMNTEKEEIAWRPGGRAYVQHDERVVSELGALCNGRLVKLYDFQSSTVTSFRIYSGSFTTQ